MDIPITQDPDFPGYDLSGGDPFDPACLHRRAEENPADWKPWLRLGYLLVQRCEPEAIPALERAIVLAPDNGLAQYLLGRAFGHAGDYARAASAMEAAVMRRPDYHLAWSILGAIRLQSAQIDEALVAWFHVVRLAPTGDAYWSIARCFIAQGRTAEATVALEEAVRLKTNHTVAHRALAYLGRLRGEPDVERRHLLRLFELDEDMARRVVDDFARKPVSSVLTWMRR